VVWSSQKHRAELGERRQVAAVNVLHEHAAVTLQDAINLVRDELSGCRCLGAVALRRTPVITRLQPPVPSDLQPEPYLRGGGEPQACHQQRAFQQTVHILFLANDRCLRDYDLVVAHC